MKELTWKPILSNLTEARGELLSLCEYLYFLDFGELPEDCHWIGECSDYIAYLQKQEMRNPFNELALFVRLEHAYHHLNWAWNCRRTPEERVLNFTDSDASRWNRFPDTASFADLWPPSRVIKEHSEKLCRRICLTPVRIPVQMAQRKLHILCYLVAKEIGVQYARPKGLYPEIGKQPLTEKDFTRRMHRIYEELNMAWNGRKHKSFATGRRAIVRSGFFPSIFATGCYNMWHKCK